MRLSNIAIVLTLGVFGAAHADIVVPTEAAKPIPQCSGPAKDYASDAKSIGDLIKTVLGYEQAFSARRMFLETGTAAKPMSGTPCQAKFRGQNQLSVNCSFKMLEGPASFCQSGPGHIRAIVLNSQASGLATTRANGKDIVIDIAKEGSNRWTVTSPLSTEINMTFGPAESTN